MIEASCMNKRNSAEQGSPTATTDPVNLQTKGNKQHNDEHSDDDVDGIAELVAELRLQDTIPEDTTDSDGDPLGQDSAEDNDEQRDDGSDSDDDIPEPSGMENATAKASQQTERITGTTDSDDGSFGQDFAEGDDEQRDNGSDSDDDIPEPSGKEKITAKAGQEQTERNTGTAEFDDGSLGQDFVEGDNEQRDDGSGSGSDDDIPGPSGVNFKKTAKTNQKSKRKTGTAESDDGSFGNNPCESSFETDCNIGEVAHPFASMETGKPIKPPPSSSNPTSRKEVKEAAKKKSANRNQKTHERPATFGQTKNINTRRRVMSAVRQVWKAMGMATPNFECDWPRYVQGVFLYDQAMDPRNGRGRPPKDSWATPARLVFGTFDGTCNELCQKAITSVANNGWKSTTEVEFIVAHSPDEFDAAMSRRPRDKDIAQTPGKKKKHQALADTPLNKLDA